MRSKKTGLHPLLILLAVALVSVLFVVSCGDDDEAAAEAAKYGGTLTLAVSADSFTLDPAFDWAIPDIFITQATYDNLLMIQPDLSYKPELATSWESNDDLSSYTFHLRQGVKFHHGKDFKAEDVLFTFNRLLDPELGSSALTFLGDIEDIVALDDYTVRFDLEGPNAFFPEYVSMEKARILPADVDVSRLTLEEFGTGPFIIEEHLPSERTVMVRNPDYWEEGKPYLDELVILLFPEAATRAEALKNGDVDVLWGLGSQGAIGIEAHPDTVVLESSSGSGLSLEMDNTIPPFDNKLVRQAMQAATDRETIRQAALLGRGSIAYDHGIAPNDPRFAADIKPPGVTTQKTAAMAPRVPDERPRPPAPPRRGPWRTASVGRPARRRRLHSYPRPSR